MITMKLEANKKILSKAIDICLAASMEDDTYINIKTDKVVMAWVTETTIKRVATLILANGLRIVCEHNREDKLGTMVYVERV